MSRRIETIVEQLEIRPHERILEIGCGHGVAASLVCQRLVDGHLLAIDRSARMIEAATRRNAAFVKMGKVEFLEVDLEALDLGDRKFDTIFAIRVGLFHREPERGRAIVERWLAPEGRLYTFYDEP